MLSNLVQSELVQDYLRYDTSQPRLEHQLETSHYLNSQPLLINQQHKIAQLYEKQSKAREKKLLKY